MTVLTERQALARLARLAHTGASDHDVATEVLCLASELGIEYAADDPTWPSDRAAKRRGLP